ncbi:hypothetical protein KAT92_03825, partial [Candidatus Babeliales bacterium]|nr:hypothetical protein [Candidatus Babeliales bacterium]
MEKKLKISRALLAVLFLAMPLAISMEGDPDDEFASLMEELFGPKPGAGKKAAQKPKSPFTAKKPAFAKPLHQGFAAQDAGVPGIASATTGQESEEKKPSARETADKTMSALILLQKSLTRVTNSLKSDLFDPDFRENVAHHITSQASLKEPAGPLWTNILIGELRNPRVIQIEKPRTRKIYREVLAENKNLLPNVEKARLKLSDLLDEIEQLRKLKKTAGYTLEQLRLPKEKRDPVKLEKQKTFDTKKKQVQQELNSFYGAITILTGPIAPGSRVTSGPSLLNSIAHQLQKVVTDPKVKQAVEKKVQTIKRLQEQAERAAKNYFPRSSSYSGRPDYGSNRFPSYPGGGNYPWSRSQGSSYSPSSYGSGKGEPTESIDKSRDKDDKEGSSSSWDSGRRKKGKDSKDKPDTKDVDK